MVTLISTNRGVLAWKTVQNDAATSWSCALLQTK